MNKKEINQQMRIIEIEEKCNLKVSYKSILRFKPKPLYSYSLICL